MDSLRKAGIRFVYCSPYNYRRTKRLASKMGLETDWNCAISLLEERSTGRKRDRGRRYEVKDSGAAVLPTRVCVSVCVVPRCSCECAAPADPEDVADDGFGSDDDHFGEGVFSDTAVRKHIINQVGIASVLALSFLSLPCECSSPSTSPSQRDCRCLRRRRRGCGVYSRLTCGTSARSCRTVWRAFGRICRYLC